MGLPAILQDLQLKSEEGMARQIQYIMKQLNKKDSQEDEDEGQSEEEEEPQGPNEEEEYSDYEELDVDQEIVGRGVPTGERLLLGEFGLAVSEEPMQKSREDYDSSSQQPIVENEKESDRSELPGDSRAPSKEKFEPPVESKKNLAEEIKNFEPTPRQQQAKEIVEPPSDSNRLPTPIAKPEEAERVPIAMQSRPKIPRTPIPTEKLEQVKKENEVLRQYAVHVYVNENANIKKQKIAHGQPGAEPEESKRQV